MFGQQNLVGVPRRGFFGKKKPEEPKVEEEKKEASAEESADAAKEGEAAKEGDADKAAAEGGAAEEEKKEGEAAESTSGSASEDNDDPVISEKELKRIKQLFNEQEDEIKALEKKNDKMVADLEQKAKDSKRQENEIKLARIEYTKQVKENEATVVRYRKMIEDEKEFAISKFAKDLLEVRDAVRMALEYTDLEAIKGEEDIEAIREKFLASCEGQNMTAEVMDKVLERFKVVQYDPKGEKFDPTLHEAVFTVQQSELANDHVEIVMQTGWKIGDRILRAAKVGIVKK